MATKRQQWKKRTRMTISSFGQSLSVSFDLLASSHRKPWEQIHIIRPTNMKKPETVHTLTLGRARIS